MLVGDEISIGLRTTLKRVYLISKVGFLIWYFVNCIFSLYTEMVMFDQQKAGVTVNRAIVSDKLGAIGCDDGSVRCSNSYLSNIYQFKDMKGTLSDREEVTCGVPQGSILRPLLFLIYVNDMESAVDCDLLLYAVDSAPSISEKIIIDIEQKLSEELTKLYAWLIDNKLSLHLGKIESILIAPNRKLKQQKFLKISCNGIKVGGREVVSYPGGSTRPRPVRKIYGSENHP